MIPPSTPFHAVATPTRHNVTIAGSAGKNLGPAGSTVVIVKNELLGTAADHCPSVLDYTKQAATSPIPSLYNTPPTYNLYMTSLVLDEYRNRGGLAEIKKTGIERAAQIYDIIDGSGALFTNQVDPGCRSRMTIPFQILGGAEPTLQDEFVRAGRRAGIEQLFLHPLFPGLRITMYNGLSDADFEVVAGFLQRFVEEHTTGPAYNKMR